MPEAPLAERAEEYEAYLVKLWRDRDGAPWRASATHVGTGVRTCFASLERLYVFLHQESYAADRGTVGSSAADEEGVGAR